MKAYVFFRDYDQDRLAHRLTEFATQWEQVIVLQMNSVDYQSGDYDENIIETVVLVSYETGTHPPTK